MYLREKQGLDHAEAQLRRAVADCLPEGEPAERVDATLKVLLEEGVSATELQSLARTAQFRTITRSATNYLLVNLLSFGAGGGVTALMAEYPPIDPAGLSKYALKLAKRLNFLTTYLASNAAIGLGGEAMMSSLRDGDALKGPYLTAGKAWPESRAGKIYRALHMWTFSVTHGYLPTLGLKPVESAKLHVLAGALAGTTAGILMTVISSLYTKPDPVWLGGRGDGAEKLRARIGYLRESSAVATGGYVKDVVKGAGKAFTSPSKEFIVRALLRFALAFVALSGRIPAAFSDNENDKVNWNMGTGIFVGLVWGAPLWAHENITTRPSPATAATPGQVAAIAPPLNLSAEAAPSPDHQV